MGNAYGQDEYSLQALLAARVTAGQRILIHAGSGGVGSMAIQIAKAWGAYVVTTCSAGKYTFVKVLGRSAPALTIGPHCFYLWYQSTFGIGCLLTVRSLHSKAHGSTASAMTCFLQQSGLFLHGTGCTQVAC